jgi:hypothetical protein
MHAFGFVIFVAWAFLSILASVLAWPREVEERKKKNPNAK